MRSVFLFTLLVTAVGHGPAIAGPTPVAVNTMPAVTVLADSSWGWDWDGFKRYWRRNLGKTTGVVGVVGLVVAVAVLIVMSAKKKT